MRRELWIGFVLATVTLAVYWPVKNHAFLDFDDDYYVTENANIQFGLNGEALAWAFTTGTQGNWHPLTWISHTIDYTLYGLNPAGHHVTNLFLHAANSLLLFCVLRLMTGAVWRSALVAALFAWHPMHVESVAWVAERKDVLSTFFGLLTLGAYGRYAFESRAGSRKSRLFYTLTLLLYALALMSKPMLVTLPFVLLLLDYWPLKRSGEWGVASDELGRAAGWRQLVREKLPFFAMALACSVVTFMLQTNAGAVPSTDALPLDARAANATVSYLRYAGKLFWPSHLCVLYPLPDYWPDSVVAAALLFVAGASVAVILFGRNRPYLPVGWLWFIGTLAPVIGLVQVGDQAMADRYSYMPYVGLFIMIAWGLGDVAARFPGLKPALVTAAAVGLIACLCCTRQQLPYWKDSITLFNRAIAVTANNPIALCNLAVTLVERGRFDEGVARAQEALDLKPTMARAEEVLAFAFSGEHKSAEAIAHYRAALQLDPHHPVTLNNLASTLATDPDEHNRDGEEAVRLAEQACAITDNLNPLFLGTLAAAYAEAGRYDDAVAANNKACDLARAVGKQDLAAALHKRLAFYEAHRPFHQEPDPAAVECASAAQMDGEGKTAAAIEHYHKALKLDPDMVAALNNLAWILATDPDPRARDGGEAVRLAEHACDLTDYAEPFFIGTLAAAYAEAGRYDQAVAAGNKARKLFLEAGMKDYAETNRILVLRYAAHQPHHEKGVTTNAHE